MNGISSRLRSLLAYSETRNLDLDDPQLTWLRYRIIAQDPFLRQIYQEWYRLLADAVSGSMSGPIIEVGSGAGFLREFIQEALTSDVILAPEIDLITDARRLPFKTGLLKGIVLNNVFHHISQPEKFLHEAARCLQSGGKMAMNEPWVTPWSRLVYSYLHHEPFQPDAPTWNIPDGGPLSSANGALPWIIFERDRSLFTQRFPEWHIRKISLHTPFLYLFSGGVAMRTLLPGWSFSFWRRLEDMLSPWSARLSMFALIILQRT